MKLAFRIVLRLLERAVAAHEKLAEAQRQRADVERRRLEDEQRFGRR